MEEKQEECRNVRSKRSFGIDDDDAPSSSSRRVMPRQQQSDDEYHQTTASTSLEQRGLLHITNHEWQEAETCLVECCETRMALLGGSHPDTLTALCHLGDLWMSDTHTDHEQAIKWYRDCYERRHKVLGESHSDTLVVMIKLGRVYCDQNKPNQACSLVEAFVLQCLKPTTTLTQDIIDEIYDTFHSFQALPDTEQVIHWEGRVGYEILKSLLGAAHSDTMTIAKLAITQYERYNLTSIEVSLFTSLTRYNQLVSLYGQYDERTFEVLEPIPFLYLELDTNPEETLLWYKRYYTTADMIYGENNPITLQAMYNLGHILCDNGQSSDALILYERCYSKRCAVLGEDDPNTLKTLYHIACVYGNRNDSDSHDQGFLLTKQCYERQRIVLGDNHSDTLLTLNNLANGYVNRRELEHAKEAYEKVVSGRESLYGNDDETVLATKCDLADVCACLDDFDTALTLYEQVYDIRKRVLGIEHRNTLQLLESMAVICQCQEKYYESLLYCERGYEIMSKVLGESDPMTVKVIGICADVYGCLGDHEKALLWREKDWNVLRERLERIEEECDREALLSMNSYADALLHAGRISGNENRLEEALPIARECVRLCEKWLGDSDEVTFFAISTLGEILISDESHKQRVQEGLQILSNGYERCVCSDSIEEDAFITLALLHDIGDAHSALGDYDTAIAVYTECVDRKKNKFGDDHKETMETLLALEKLQLK